MGKGSGLPSSALTRPLPGGSSEGIRSCGRPHGSETERAEPGKAVATIETSWEQAGQQPEDARGAARAASKEDGRIGEPMTSRTPTQAGIDAGAAVVANASKRDPVITLTLILGALLMAGSIWIMYSEIKDSRRELLAAIHTHENNGHAASVSKVELANAVAGLQRGLDKLGEKMDAQNAAMAARIDRLIERTK